MKRIRQLLAATIIYQYNMRMMHWNVTTTDFDPVHGLMAEYASKFDALIDQITELAMQVGLHPVSYIEAWKIIESLEGIDFIVFYSEESLTPIECFQSIGVMMEQLVYICEMSIKEDGLSGDIISELETIQQYFRKEGMYKNARRLMGN